VVFGYHQNRSLGIYDDGSPFASLDQRWMGLLRYLAATKVISVNWPAWLQSTISTCSSSDRGTGWARLSTTSRRNTWYERFWSGARGEKPHLPGECPPASPLSSYSTLSHHRKRTVTPSMGAPAESVISPSRYTDPQLGLVSMLPWRYLNGHCGVAVGLGRTTVAVAVGGRVVAVGGTGVSVGMSVGRGVGIRVGVAVTVGVAVVDGVGDSVGKGLNDGLGVLVGVGLAVAAGAVRDASGQLQPIVIRAATTVVPRTALLWVDNDELDLLCRLPTLSRPSRAMPLAARVARLVISHTRRLCSRTGRPRHN
jgi:hypothetical protein